MPVDIDDMRNRVLEELEQLYYDGELDEEQLLDRKEVADIAGEYDLAELFEELTGYCPFEEATADACR